MPARLYVTIVRTESPAGRLLVHGKYQRGRPSRPTESGLISLASRIRGRGRGFSCSVWRSAGHPPVHVAPCTSVLCDVRGSARRAGPLAPSIAVVFRDGPSPTAPPFGRPYGARPCPEEPWSFCRAIRIMRRRDPVVFQLSIAPDSRGVSLVEGEDATEPFASADAGDGRDRIARREGDDVSQALMVALGVVVLHELAHDGAQATLAERDDVSQALVLDRANKPFRVAPRRDSAPRVARPRDRARRAPPAPSGAATRVLFQRGPTAHGARCDAPKTRAVQPPSGGKIVSLPRVGGLHHATREPRELPNQFFATPRHHSLAVAA